MTLARACAEWLATRTRSYTLFATHYFELTELPESLPTTANVHLDATEYSSPAGDKLVLLHQVKPGPANRSFGIQVASLAGIPRPVIDQARQYLKALESRHLDTATAGPQQSLLLQEAPARSAVLELLSTIDPDRLSPKEALDWLYRLKAEASRNSGINTPSATPATAPGRSSTWP